MKLPIALALVALISAPIHALDITIPAPVADTFVNSKNADSNFGGAGALQVTASGNTSGEFDSLMKFDLSSTVASLNTQFGAGQWIITNVKLSLGTNFGTQGSQPNNPLFAPINAGLFGVRWMQNDSWVEGTGNPGAATTDGVTFNTLGSFLTGSDTSIGTFSWGATGNGVMTYPLNLAPSFVSDLMSGGNVSMEVVAADSGVSYLFDSRSFPTVPNRPQLIVSAQSVPEPGSVSLAMLGIALIATRRRRS